MRYGKFAHMYMMLKKNLLKEHIFACLCTEQWAKQISVWDYSNNPGSCGNFYNELGI
jgi:hypothetical protein